jgi:hypothetical protein
VDIISLMFIPENVLCYVLSTNDIGNGFEMRTVVVVLRHFKRTVLILILCCEVFM